MYNFTVPVDYNQTFITYPWTHFQILQFPHYFPMLLMFYSEPVSNKLYNYVTHWMSAPVADIPSACICMHAFFNHNPALLFGALEDEKLYMHYMKLQY